MGIRGGKQHRLRIQEGGGREGVLYPSLPLSDSLPLRKDQHPNRPPSVGMLKVDAEVAPLLWEGSLGENSARKVFLLMRRGLDKSTSCSSQ